MLTPRQVATLIALLFELFVAEQRKARSSGATRLRMRRSTFARVAGRKRLRDALIEQVGEELAEFGLIMFPAGEDLCVILTTSAQAFPRIRYEGKFRELVHTARRFDDGEWERTERRLLDPNADEDDEG